MATLDFSFDKPGSSNMQPRPHDPLVLIDQSSLGTRTADGLYEVKDWEFSKREEVDDMITDALRPTVDKEAAVPGSLGVLGSLFARLTGSKILTPQDLKPVLEGMKQHLMKKNVAKEIADKVCEGVGESLVGKKIGGFQSMCFHHYGLIIVRSWLCSHEHSRPSCAFYRLDPHSYTENFHGPVAIYQNQALVTPPLHATTSAI
jgi:hypothetical protein